MSYETIEFDVSDNIATITLNRPDSANALNAKMADELFDASIRCAADPSVRAAILTARGKLFCGGGDLNEMDEAGDGRPAHLLRMATVLHQAVMCVFSFLAGKTGLGGTRISRTGQVGKFGSTEGHRRFQKTQEATGRSRRTRGR